MTSVRAHPLGLTLVPILANGRNDSFSNRQIGFETKVSAFTDLVRVGGPLRNTLTPAELARVLIGAAFLKIWGALNYQDVFGKKYLVECEGTYNPKENNFFIDRFKHPDDKERDGKAN